MLAGDGWVEGGGGKRGRWEGCMRREGVVLWDTDIHGCAWGGILRFRGGVEVLEGSPCWRVRGISYVCILFFPRYCVFMSFFCVLVWMSFIRETEGCGGKE